MIKRAEPSIFLFLFAGFSLSLSKSKHYVYDRSIPKTLVTNLVKNLVKTWSTTWPKIWQTFVSVCTFRAVVVVKFCRFYVKNGFKHSGLTIEFRVLVNIGSSGVIIGRILS